jgi:hypothetical protein
MNDDDIFDYNSLSIFKTEVDPNTKYLLNHDWNDQKSEIWTEYGKNFFIISVYNEGDDRFLDRVVDILKINGDLLNHIDKDRQTPDICMESVRCNIKNTKYIKIPLTNKMKSEIVILSM